MTLRIGNLGALALVVVALAGCQPSIPAPLTRSMGDSRSARSGTELGRGEAWSSAATSSSVDLRLLLTAAPDSPPVETGIPVTEPMAAEEASACNEQAPQDFLMRSSYAFDPNASRDETANRKRLHRHAIEYRTRRYGYVDGFGDPSWNAHEPDHYATSTSFFGIPIRMNRRVAVALACVETSIRRDCADTPYTPHNLDGIRFRNTFHDNEITNHAYGIAIDIDFDKNPCCGCFGALKNAARCKDPSTTAYERTYLPKCWIDTFDKFGFYWLGKDQLEDTMHFEFLGDPSKITKTPSSK